MTSVSTDRRFGINSGAAVKVPCRCATTAAITLNGLQTIDGITVVADDRVLVKNQASSIANGIYSASTGNWARAPDFDGKFDVKSGTLILVNGGTANGTRSWRLTSADPVTIGSSAMTFALADVGGGSPLDDASLTVLRTEAGAVATTQHQVNQAALLNLMVFDSTIDNTGVADITTKLQAALNSASGGLFIPAGNYKFSAVSVPTTCHAIVGAGAGATVLVCGGVTANVWISLNAALQGFVFRDLSITQNKTTFSAATAIYCDTSSYVTVENIVFNDAGRLAIITYGTDSTIRNCTFISFGQTAIVIDLGAQRITVENNKILSAGTSHGISINATGSGGRHVINDNYVFHAGTASFCISITAPDTVVSNNRCVTNTAEGINVQDVSFVSVTDNIITCEASHADFAISLFAAVTAVEKCVVSGNRMHNSGKSGIGLASATGGASFCRYNHIVGNLISDPVQLGAGVTALARGGIILYGPNTSANTVQANRILDEANNMLYGVVEWNDGSGNPGTNNLLDNNVLTKGAGFLSEAKILTTASKVWFTDFESYTPTITSGTGTITTTVINAAKFKPRGKQIFLRLDITITTNGTGATNIQATLPTGYNAVAGSGVLNGKESVVTGSAITGDCSSTSCTIKTYNNAYPGADTARLILDGFYEAA